MSPRPDLGPKPRLGYTASLIERATERRADAAALAALENDPRARAYVVGGEMVVLNKAAEVHDPLFTLAQARGLGHTAERVFLGLIESAPRFAVALEPADAEALKARADLMVTDLRTIAVRGLVEAEARRCSPGTCATAFARIAVRQARSSRPAGGATVGPAAPSISRVPIRW
jgi:NAD+ diphosphatase